MIDQTVEILRDVATKVADHLPVLFTVYTKEDADAITEGEYPDLTDDEWDKVYAKFERDIDPILGLMWDAFQGTVLSVVHSREETK